VASDLYRAIARLVTGAGVASHRADVTILQCAKALAALAGHERVEPGDLLDAAALALGHRVPVDPFEPGSGLDDRLLRRILEDALDAETSEKKAAVPVRPGRTRH
jgi:Mg-chelatase subunit ChlI